jgi:chemotaxis protein methyltransferase CheR
VTGRLAPEVEDRVASYVESRTGLSCGGAGERRLHHALRQTALPRTASRRGDAEPPLTEEALDRLCEALTVQESYFFREPAKLRVVRDRLHDAARDRRAPVRVWSAGCAQGEEAYTLAALCIEAGLEDRFRVLGTDLSHAAVAAARRGRYSRWSVRGMEQARLDELFESHEKSYEVRDRIRDNVSFAQHNLLQPRPSEWGRFDLILCRNVLIYFTPEAARAAIDTLADALVPGGWLVLGAADPLADSVPELEPVLASGGLTYRRRSSSDTPTASDATRDRGRGLDVLGDLEALRDVRTVPRPRPAAPAADRRRSVPGPPTAPRRPTAAPSTTTAAPAPSDAEVAALLGAAEQALAAARPEEAEERAREALRSSSRSKEGHLLLVQALAEQHRLSEALSAAGEAVALFPTDSEVRHLQAVVTLERGDAEAAAVVARQALYLDPELAGAHLVLGRAQELLGNTTAARRARRNGRRLLSEMSTE